MGPDLRSILFDTQAYVLLKTGYIAYDDLKSEDIEILTILKIVQKLLEGTVHVLGFLVLKWFYGFEEIYASVISDNQLV